jgi:branched-chain amino acid transport system permease protein
LGKIVRAAVSDRDMVMPWGSTSRGFMLVFGNRTWLAGISGVAIAPILTVFPAWPTRWAWMPSSWSARAVSESFRRVYRIHHFRAVEFLRRPVRPQLAPVLMVAFMAIVLAIKPHGLLGVKED